MCNATNRHFNAAALLLASSLLGACSSEQQKEHAQAEALLSEAQGCIDGQSYESAINLIDSISAAFPSQVEVRKAALPLRAKAMKELSEKRLLETDSLIAMLRAQLEQCGAATLRIAGDADIDGYYVSASVPRLSLGSQAGIEPRVSDADYSFYIVASAGNKRIGVNQIVLKSAAGEEVASSKLAPQSARAGDPSEFGSDVATFYGEEVGAIASWADEHAHSPATLIIRGAQGSDISVPLSAAQLQALATLWRQASLFTRLRGAEQLRQKLERQCIIARDQELNL